MKTILSQALNTNYNPAEIRNDWLFPPSIEEAKQIQRQIAERVFLTDDFSLTRFIGGVDVSQSRNDPEERIYAAAVSLNKQSLCLEEEASVCQRQTFPYIPGFLGFRESPALVEAIQKLKKRPEVLLVDGHGISHPRRLGIASHLGVLLDLPTIGVAKSILVGHPAAELGEKKGDCTPLIWKGEKIGMLLRSKVHCNPLIISTGHRISLESALEIVQDCLTRYRLPEPTRQAHLAANRYRRLNENSVSV